VILGASGSTKAESGLNIKTGFGYEYMSQKFFLDSLQYSGVDTVAVTTALNTTYLDDIKGYVGIDYVPYEDYRLELRSTFEQTPEQSRVRLNTDFRPRLGVWSLNYSSELDWRDGAIEQGEDDEGYLSGYGRARLSLATSREFSVWGQFKGDFVRFDQPRETAFDYHRYDGQFGITYDFSSLSTLTASFFAGGRQVTSNQDQDYGRLGLEASFLSFYGGGDLDLLASYEKRDYDRPDDLGDYQWFELTGRHRHDLAERLFAREEFEFEDIRFGNNELYTADYFRLGGKLLVGLKNDVLSVALGPDFEILNEDQVEEGLIGQDYRELGLLIQLDLMSPGSVFGTIESVLGQRNVGADTTEESLHSDFVYERLNLLADWSITSAMNLNLVLSTDWEWHDNREENSRLTLISTGLYYSF
jgi:hypothetical protein